MSAGLAGDRASAGNPAQIIRTVDDDRMILHRPASMPQKALVLGTPVWVPPMMWYCICSIMSRSCSSLLDPDTSVISSQPQPQTRDWLAGVLVKPVCCCISVLYVQSMGTSGWAHGHRCEWNSPKTKVES